MYRLRRQPRRVRGAATRRYEYSGEGYLLARHDSARGPTRYALDAAHRLIGEELPNGHKRVFEHDAAGNVLDHAGRLATYHPGNILADAGLRRYEHDLRHAVCTEAWQGGFRRFHRDERDQLVRVESYRASAGGAAPWDPGPDWTARYDALNRRIDKTVAGQTTVFYWDTDRLAVEVMPSGGLRIYVYADALAMTPMLVVDYASVDAAPESGIVYAVFADHLGCPERVEDMAGQTVWAAIIAPYGAAEITVGAAFHQPLRWPGHYYDTELGLQYNRFRTYAPELGRYLEPDPLGRAGGLENVYAYTNNPLFRVDVNGLCPRPNPEEEPPSGEEDGKPDEELPAGGAGTARLQAIPPGSPLNRPAIAQEQPMSCGQAAARMVIQTRTGSDVPEADLRAATQGQPGGYDPNGGTNMTQVASTLQSNGVPSATTRGGQSVTDLQTATAGGDPAIVHVNNPPVNGAPQTGHFMVVDGVVTNPDGSRTVVGRDPAGGNFAVPESAFINRGYSGWAITT